MPGWDEEKRYKVVRTVEDAEVRCFMDGQFHVMTYDAVDREKLQRKEKDYCDKTYAIKCGTYDGEYIDLFDLQEWFDKNRIWIDMLRQEINE